MIDCSTIQTRFKTLSTKWKEMLNPLRAGLVGLDIGNGAVKLIWLQKDQNGWLANAAAWTVVEPAKDQEVREENISRAIQECFRNVENASPVNSVCGLSGPEVAVRSFSFPYLPDGALDQAVQLEAQQVCAFDATHTVVDFQLIEDPTSTIPGKNPTYRKGYLVAGLEDAINQKVRIAQATRIKPVLLDVNSLAALNCICQTQESFSTDTFAVLDIGHTHSYLAILGSNGMPFVRDLTCSSQQIMVTMSEHLQKNVTEIRNALDQDSFDSEKPEIALRFACGRLIADILETLRFYSLQQNTEKVSRVFLCGGMALAKSFVRLMEQALPVPTLIFNPAENIRCIPGSKTQNILQQYGPAMTVAAGLAMRTGE